MKVLFLSNAEDKHAFCHDLSGFFGDEHFTVEKRTCRCFSNA